MPRIPFFSLNRIHNTPVSNGMHSPQTEAPRPTVEPAQTDMRDPDLSSFTQVDLQTLETNPRQPNPDDWVMLDDQSDTGTEDSDAESEFSQGQGSVAGDTPRVDSLSNTLVLKPASISQANIDELQTLSDDLRALTGEDPTDNAIGLAIDSTLDLESLSGLANELETSRDLVLPDATTTTTEKTAAQDLDPPPKENQSKPMLYTLSTFVRREKPLISKESAINACFMLSIAALSVYSATNGSSGHRRAGSDRINLFRSR